MEFDRPKSKFSIGDYVYIRSNAKTIPELTLDNRMLKYLGTTRQIRWVWYTYSPYPLRNIFVYYLTDVKKPNDDFWNWAEEWLEPAANENFDSDSVVELIKLEQHNGNST